MENLRIAEEKEKDYFLRTLAEQIGANLTTISEVIKGGIMILHFACSLNCTHVNLSVVTNRPHFTDLKKRLAFDLMLTVYSI